MFSRTFDLNVIERAISFGLAMAGGDVGVSMIPTRLVLHESPTYSVYVEWEGQFCGVCSCQKGAWKYL